MMSGPVEAPLWVFGLGAIVILGVIVLIVILTNRS
jgi:hypothetical protein